MLANVEGTSRSPVYPVYGNTNHTADATSRKSAHTERCDITIRLQERTADNRCVIPPCCGRICVRNIKNGGNGYKFLPIEGKPFNRSRVLKSVDRTAPRCAVGRSEYLRVLSSAHKSAVTVCRRCLQAQARRRDDVIDPMQSITHSLGRKRILSHHNKIRNSS